MKLVTVLLPEAYLEGLDELVRANMYPSRSSVIRSSVCDLLKKELWETNADKTVIKSLLSTHKVSALQLLGRSNWLFLFQQSGNLRQL